LSPDEEVTLDVTSGNQGVTALPDANGGLGLFLDNSDFGSNSGDQVLDYLQWGAADQNRASQGVAAGRWDDVNNFVPGEAPYNLIGGVTDIGASFWIDDTPIRLLEITPEMDEVVIRNFGSVDRDLTNYFFCTLAGIYPNLGNPSEVEVLSGDLNLSPGEEVSLRVLSSGGVVDVDGSIFLFSSSLLGFNNQNPAVTRDFAQWGAPDGFRVENAVVTNRWDSNESFIAGTAPFSYTGEANDVGATFWEATATSSSNLDDNSGIQVKLSPNPATTYTQLSIEGAQVGPVHIRMLDATGREVLSLHTHGQSDLLTTDFDLSGLANGVYIIQALIDGEISSVRLMVGE
ncbi:MAG: T9SS type A sorting domain-containing protein, partial [Bacteroidota bacterium]